MTWLPFESHRPRAAALAVGVALAAGVALIATSAGGRAPARRATPAAPATAPTPLVHTPAGAVSAATAWSQDVARGPYDGTWGTATSSLSTPAMQARLRTVNPAAALLYRDLTAPPAPRYLVRTWPLGYAVQQYSPTSARVRVWQLDVLELARPSSAIAYTAVTVVLKWTEGSWRVAGILNGTDLTPPGGGATAAQTTAWIEAVDQLHGYSYAP